ncbi:MAG: hypothetical protein FJ215_04695 [Ignavibacteria bacterium]|nr:hypothetical protein [Ignavibacteria bacterium]
MSIKSSENRAIIVMCLFCRKSTTVLFVLLSTAATLVAQEIVSLQKLTGEITLDGWSNEPGWQSVAPFTMTMSSPTYGSPPSEATEIRVAYNREALYVSGRFLDSDVKNLRASTLVRDAIGPQDDLFCIILDTFNDNENALGFLTSPAGIRSDFAVFNDAETAGPPPFNQSWNTF